MECEFCGQESATVRNRPRYGEEPMALCADCWGDLQEATRPVEIPNGAVTATEVSAQPGNALIASPDAVREKMETRVLFPTPEADRAGLIQRAKIGVARMNKDKVAALKVQHFGSAEAKYEEVDLAALVAFVNAVEAPL